MSQVTDGPERELPPPGWVPPDRTCMIAATRRSGSNMLCAAMQATGQLGKPEEYFNIGLNRRLYPDQQGTPADNCHNARRDAQSANGVVAFKLFPEQLRRVQDHLVFSAWFPDPFWIWIRRHDVLGQAISLVISKQTHLWTVSHTARKQPSYSTEQILAAINEIAQANAAWEKYFARIGAAPMLIWYEDFAADPPAFISRIAAGLGVNLQLPDSGVFDRLEMKSPTDPRLDRKIEVQRTSMNAEWRERFVAEAGGPDLPIAFRTEVAPR